MLAICFYWLSLFLYCFLAWYACIRVCLCWVDPCCQSRAIVLSIRFGAVSFFLFYNLYLQKKMGKSGIVSAKIGKTEVAYMLEVLLDEMRQRDPGTESNQVPYRDAFWVGVA